MVLFTKPLPVGYNAPRLVVSSNNSSMWRVPVHLTWPAFGDVGRVGFLHVNPQTGEMDTSPLVLTALIQAADVLAKRFPSPAGQLSGDHSIDLMVIDTPF